MKKTLLFITLLLTIALLSSTALATFPRPNGGGGPTANIDQEQEAHNTQGALQIIIKPKKTPGQDQCIDIGQSQKAKGVKHGEVEQEQESCVGEFAVQIGYRSRQSQLQTTDVDEDQVVYGLPSHGCCRKPSMAEIEQEQEHESLQIDIEIGICSRQNTWQDIDVTQAEKTPASGEVEQEQESSVTQVGITIGIGSNQNRDQWAVVNQNEVNTARGADLKQGQENATTQVAIQGGIRSNQNQRQNSFTDQNQRNNASGNVDQSQNSSTSQFAAQFGIGATMNQYQGTSVTQTQFVGK